MKQKKRLAVIALLLCLVMVFGLASCGSDAGTPTTSPSANPGTPTISPSADPIEEPSGDTTMTLVMAEVNPIDSIIGQMDQEFKKQVEELSGGSIIIDIKADGVLGAEEEVLDSMVNHPDSNTIDIARISAFSLNSYGVEKTVFLTLPFIFETTRHFWNFAESELAQEFLNEPQEIGLPVRGLFFGTEGFRHFFVNNDLPLDSIYDLEGLTLRVADDPIMREMVESLGATPSTVLFTELKTALTKGDCNGAEQPIGNYQSNGFDEVAGNVILDGHTMGAVQVIISDETWNKLTEDQQAIIMEAAANAQQFNKDMVDDAEAEVLAELKEKGVNIVEVLDKDIWFSMVSDMLEPYISGDMADLYQEIADMKLR